MAVPCASLTGEPGKMDPKQPSGINYGFVVNTQHIVDNKDFVQKNPAAGQVV